MFDILEEVCFVCFVFAPSPELFVLVRFISTCGLVRMLILSECVYRVLKNDLRARMRALLQQLPLPRVSPFQQLLCDTYNAVLGADEAFWAQVGVLLRKKFGDRLMQGARVDALSHVKQLARGGSDVVRGKQKTFFFLLNLSCWKGCCGQKSFA